jgi:hypothetical protein
MKKSFYTASFLVLSACANAAIVEVSFSTDGLLLRNNLGGLLSAGGLANGDGALLELGYFSSATPAGTGNFSGTWIPLTGPNSGNTEFALSSIGDGEGPNGEAYPLWAFDTARPNSVAVMPAVGTVLSIRFYNAQSLAASTFFNTVSNDTWLWKAPGLSAPTPPQVLMSLQDGSLEWQSISVSGQAGTTAFTTSLPVPEPTSAFLVAVGAAGLMMRRRRQS